MNSFASEILKYLGGHLILEREEGSQHFEK